MLRIVRRCASATLALAVIVACGVSDARMVSENGGSTHHNTEAAVVIAPERDTASAPQPRIEQLLARFRQTVSMPPPEAMAGARSIEELVARFAASLERADTNAFRDMALTRAEFAYLYYPESPYTERPYRQDPALLWFLIQEGSNKGLTRLFNRYAGSSLGYVGHACAGERERHGATTLWTACVVRRVIAPGDTIGDRLFGTIVERDGRFRFLSYANKL